MAAGAAGDSRILGPAAAERPDESMRSPGLLILLTRLGRKPLPLGLAGQGQSFLSSLFYVLVCVWKKDTPHRQPAGYGNCVVSPFFSKAQKSQASFSSGWFPVDSVATLSNMAARPVPLVAGYAVGLAPPQQHALPQTG